MSTSITSPEAPSAPAAPKAEAAPQATPNAPSLPSAPAAPPIAAAPPIVTVIELDSDDEMQGDSKNGNGNDSDEEDERVLKRAYQNGKMASRTSESHYEKGLMELRVKCKALRDQRRTLRSEKEELQNKLLKQALTALGGGPDPAPSSALEKKCAALEQELAEAKKYKATQNGCILELNGKLSAVQQHLQIAENRLKTPLTGDGAAADLANLHKELGEKAARIKELEASLLLQKKLTKEKDELAQKLSDQLAVSSQLGGPVFSKAHMAEIQTEREKTAAAEARLENALRTKEAYEKEVNALEAAKEELDEQMLALRDELRGAKEDLEWSENEKGDLEEDLLEIMRESGKSAMDAFQELKDKVAKLKLQLAAAQESIDAAQHDLIDEANDKEKLENKYDAVKGKLSDVNKRLATESKQNKAHQKRISTLEADVERLEKELKALKRKAADSNGSSVKLQELQEENDRLASVGRKAARQVEDLKESMEELRGELEASQAGEATAQQQLASLTAKHRAEIQRIENSKKESDKKVNLLNCDIAKFQDRVNGSAATIKTLEEKLSKVECEKKDLAKRMTSNQDTESQIEKLQKEKTALATALDAAKKRVTTLEEQVSALNEGLERQRTYSDALEGQVKALKEDLTKGKENAAPVVKDSATMNGSARSAAPGSTAPSTPAIARAPSVASSTASKLTATSSRDVARLMTDNDLAEAEWHKFAGLTRRKFFMPGNADPLLCAACQRLNVIHRTNDPVPRIESHREQVKHVLAAHMEQLGILKAKWAEGKTGLKRAGSSVDAGSPKRVRTESQEMQ